MVVAAQKDELAEVARWAGGIGRVHESTAGRIENRQIGVFLASACAKRRTLLDRELYLPQVWAEDRERREDAGAGAGIGGSLWLGYLR